MAIREHNKINKDILTFKETIFKKIKEYNTNTMVNVGNVLNGHRWNYAHNGFLSI